MPPDKSMPTGNVMQNMINGCSPYSQSQDLSFDCRASLTSISFSKLVKELTYSNTFILLCSRMANGPALLRGRPESAAYDPSEALGKPA